MVIRLPGRAIGDEVMAGGVAVQNHGQLIDTALAVRLFGDEHGIERENLQIAARHHADGVKAALAALAQPAR